MKFAAFIFGVLVFIFSSNVKAAPTDSTTERVIRRSRIRGENYEDWLARRGRYQEGNGNYYRRGLFGRKR